MAPVETNATLTEVSKGGTREEPGAEKPAGAGESGFEGEARIYYQRKRERIPTAAGVDVRIRRILHVDTRDPELDWREGDVVAFVSDRGEAGTGTVQTVTPAELGALAGSGVETTKVELEPA